MTTKPTTTATARRTAKKKDVYIYNQHHAILYISLPSLHHYDMKLPNFTSPLYGVGERNTKIVVSFFLTYITIDTAPKKISPGFAKLNEIE